MKNTGKRAGGKRSSASQKAKASAALKPAAAISSVSEFDEVLAMVESAWQRAYQAVNTELVGLYWQLGEYISHKIESAQWGDGVVDALAATIAHHYPGLRGYMRANLFRMRQLYETCRGDEKVSPLVRQLPWTHHLIVLSRCSVEDNEVVEYALARTTSPTLVAEYQTVLPPKELLRQKLRELYAQLAPAEATPPGAKASSSKPTAPPEAKTGKKPGRRKR